jgi:hypothetical protein
MITVISWAWIGWARIRWAFRIMFDTPFFVWGLNGRLSEQANPPMHKSCHDIFSLLLNGLH